MRLGIGAAVLFVLLSVVGASAQSAKPSLYGKVVFFTSTAGVSPLSGGNVEIYEVDSSKRFAEFALASPKPLSEARTDSRGFYSFYRVNPGVYMLRVLRGGEVGGGSIAVVAPGGTGVPDMAVSWDDPCRFYYGRGYAADYIRTKINAPWRANAADWLQVAARAGWMTRGNQPAGNASIVVFGKTAQAPFGHVAWVDSVDANRHTFEVSQWNEPGQVAPGQKCYITSHFGRLTRSTWRFGEDHRVLDEQHIVGFIYHAPLSR